MHAPLQLNPNYFADLLVIGYGNTLRRDDGVGPLVAERVEALHLPRVWTLSLPLLAPEHAECLSHVPAAIFVDAAVGTSQKVRRHALKPAQSSRVISHAVSAQTLLAIARDSFGRVPRAWLLTVPAFEMGYGQDLSPGAQAGLEAAVAEIVAFTAKPQPRALSS